jgi:hypothetical protein
MARHGRHARRPGVAAGTEIDRHDLREQDGTVEITGLRQRLVPLLQWSTLGARSGLR